MKLLDGSTGQTYWFFRRVLQGIGHSQVLGSDSSPRNMSDQTLTHILYWIREPSITRILG